MGMVDEMSLKKKKKKEMEIIEEDERLSERGWFWVKLSENGEEMKKIEGVRYGEFRERK